MAIVETKLALAGIYGNQFVVQLQISQGDKLVEIVHETAGAGIAKMGDVVNLRSRRRECTAKHFLEVRAINPGTEPIEAHVLGGRRVIFPRVLHGEILSEGPAKTREQPVSVVAYHWLGLLPLFDKIGDCLYDDVFREAV